MDIYLTLLETGDMFRFPMLPEEIKTTMGNQFASYQILGAGEIQVPSGMALDTVSWSGIFPGISRSVAPYYHGEEMDPLEGVSWLENVKSKAGASKKMRLLITDTTINLDVYLVDFKGQYRGGQGDFYYEISLIQGKDLTVTATEAAVAVERPEPAPSTTYTVVKGDCLWNIALKLLGSGARYTEIYAANKALIDGQNGGSSKLIIYPGQVFTIPS